MPSELLNAEEKLSLAAVEKLSATKGEPAWLLEKRRKGWELFETLPTPDWTRGIRNWWSSTLSEVIFDEFQPYAAAGNDLGFKVGGTQDMVTSGLLVQHNSEVIRVELSDEARAAGVWFGSIDNAVKEKPELIQKYFMSRAVLPEEDRLMALHAALWSGGAFLYVPKNVTLDAPFQVVVYGDAPNLAAFTHTLIVAEAGSKVRLIEDHRSRDTETKWLNAGVTEIFVGTRAKVEYYNPQEWGLNCLDYSVRRAMVGREGRIDWVSATMGASSSWLTLESILEGEGAHSEIVGFSFSTARQRYDVKFLQKHIVPHTTATSLFKAVLDDKSQTGFRGAIRVLKPGQNTESLLTDHTLFLSEAAKGDALPSLDVDANDVRCSHGASIGMIDKDQIFYLQSRGLSRPEAEKMIVAGFLEEVIGRIPLVSVRDRLREAIDLKQGGAGAMREVEEEGQLFTYNDIEKVN